jgi:hypothetical protein
VTLQAGVAAPGTTAYAADDFSASCGGTWAPDAVYAFTVPNGGSHVRATVTPAGQTLDPVLSVRSVCAVPGAELPGACSDAVHGAGTSELLDLPDVAPGTYFLVVDSATAGGGAFTFQVDLLPPVPQRPPGDLCEAPLALPANQTLANDTTTYLASSQFQFRDPETQKVAKGSAKAAAWTTALSSTLHEFAGAGILVVVVDTVPHFRDWDLAQCPAIRIYLDVASCGTSASRTAIALQQLPGLYATRTAMEGLANVSLVDFTDDGHVAWITSAQMARYDQESETGVPAIKRFLSGVDRLGE